MIEKNIGDRLKEARKALKKSQKDLGAALGITHQGYSKIENGLSSLTLENLMLIVSNFEINPIWLLTGDGEITISQQSSSDIQFLRKEIEGLKKTIDLYKEEIKKLEEQNDLYLNRINELEDRISKQAN